MSLHRRPSSGRPEAKCLKIPTGQITPPVTPNASQEDLGTAAANQRRHCYGYLRAFHPYHPPYDNSSSTVILPLNDGDVILIHSVDTNGWADGTLLNSGLRGWLPTNYCEPYDHQEMEHLLNALTNFWDVISRSSDGFVAPLHNQDYMRRLVSGVRYLLDTTGCLRGDAPMVARHPSISGNRKVLLSKLTALVKLAKGLETHLTQSCEHPELDDEYLNDMVLRAFDMVLRGLSFHDSWQLEAGPQRLHEATSVSPKGFAQEVHHLRSTPTNLETVSTGSSNGHPKDSDKRVCAARQRPAVISAMMLPEQNQKQMGTSAFHGQSPSMLPLRSTLSSSMVASRFARRPSTLILRRCSAQRASCGARLTSGTNVNLASEKLSTAHELLLNSLSGFIALNAQSRTCAELLLTTQEVVNRSKCLVEILEEIWDRGYHGAERLQDIRDELFDKVAILIDTLQLVLKTPDGEEVDAEDRRQLTDNAMSCMPTAGDVVGKGRYVLELIGDFEFEPAAPSVSALAKSGGTSSDLSSQMQASGCTVVSSSRPPSPPSPSPLPPASSEGRPQISDSAKDIPGTRGNLTPPPDRMSVGSWLPPLPRLTSPTAMNSEYSPASQTSHASFTEIHDDGYHIKRKESFSVSSIFSDSTAINSKRGSERSMISVSTGATSFDMSELQVAKFMPNESRYKAQITVEEDSDEAEASILGTTFAHELVFNKEGQVSGGTLPALVERLTAHDSTPDACFVSTFYLTFRLFASAKDFARTLIERFENVGDVQTIALPIQLRVWNILKGWLESYWRPDCDAAALEALVQFARGSLAVALPFAGQRLLELAEKVSATNVTLFPRHISLLGKTNAAITSFVPSATSFPAPAINKSQLNLLKSWKNGGASPSIMDFDALELARQLTLSESRIFCAVLPEELLGQEWSRKTGSAAVNVRALSTLATDLGHLVVDSILRLEDPSKRAKLIKHWVKIAEKCLELNNYESIMVIICALQSSIIARLFRTWDAVASKTKATYEHLKTVVDCSMNHKALRTRLQNHVSPCLPFVGIYLTDLTMVDHGNSNTRLVPSSNPRDSMSVINFDKYVRTSKIIGELQRFQTPYCLQDVPDLQAWMQDQLTRVHSTDEEIMANHYYQLSVQLEPSRSCANKTPPSPLSPTSPTFAEAEVAKGAKADIFTLMKGKFSKSSGPTVRTASTAQQRLPLNQVTGMTTPGASAIYVC